MSETVGMRIRSIRKKLDMTQKELSKTTGIKQSFLSGIETSAKLPTLEHLIEIAHALGVEASDLIGEKFCPVCGFEYSYDEGLNSAAHKRIHDRALEIIDRYGFFWPYRARKIEYTTAYAVLTSKTSSTSTMYHAAICLFRSLFCRSVAAYTGDDHPTFETYAAMLLGSGEYSSLIKPEVYDKLIKDFGKTESMLTGTYYQRVLVPPAGSKNGIHPRLYAILEKMQNLPAEYIDIIEYICNRAK